MRTAPDPLYVQAFLFKEADTSQVFDFKTSTCIIPPACNLLVADKKRGLLYIGHDDKLTVFKPAEENNAEWKLDLQLPGIISKTAINCDCSYVAVALAMKPTILVYDAQSLIKNNLLLLLEIVSSNKPDSYVTDIRWNPTIATMFCTVTSDYTIGTFNLKAEEGNSMFPKLSVVAKVSNEPQALCATWSPKGKQMVVGCKNGDIVQLKPDTLKVARTITGPSPFIGEVISILWISNYQFCAAYVNSERHINVLIIDAVKGESNATFTCYEDITYGFPDAEGEGSVPRYYFEHVPEWGLIVAGSSISSEIAVLGTTDGGTNWNQWQLVDSGRAQLPLMRTTEIYPIGLVVDRSSTKVLPWGVDSTLPHPVPILHILTTSGRLCSFHMVNLAPDCPAINSPPTEVFTVPALVTSLNPSHPAVPSTEMSFNMNAAATSTPARPKQADVVPDRAPAPVTNIFGNSLKVAGFFQQSVEQPKPQEEKPTSLMVTKSPAVLKETPVLEPQPKTEIKLAADKEVNSPQAAEQKASIDDSIRMRAYLQEQELFEKELRNRLESHVCEINIWESDEEKKRLGETSVVIEQFLRDLRDTTNSLSSDIAYLKALLLQSFAWVEETKSKNAASTGIGRNCSENSKIADLRRWYYYTQTQLNQISKVLDLELLEHKDMSKKLKMKIPNLEYVYQNLLLHHKILTKEKEKIDQISRQWKSHNRLGYRPNDVSSLNCSMASLHVSSPKSSVSAIREKTDVIDARCKAIATKTLSFTHEKQIKLKALLTETPPKTIKLVNQSTIQDRLEATLFSLASVNPALTEAKTKPEPPIVSKQTIVKQTLEKPAKSLSPLASLNSIVARIGSSDTSSTIVQNKPQQKTIPTTVSFPVTISIKQTEKKSVGPATTKTSQPKLKQDFNAFPSSITFGMSAPKSQEMLFQKSPLIDASARKELTTSDTISKAPESTLFSTGLLKEALSTKYPLSADTARVEVAHNLPLLSAASIAKTDAAATFSFAIPTIPPTVTKSSSGAALNSMSLAYSKSQQSPIVETPAMTAPTLTQAPIELSALSLGSPVSLTLQSANHSSNDGKMNAITTGMNFAISTPASVTTQTLSMPPVATTIATISGVTISLVDANAARKSTEPVPSINSISIEKLTAPELKASSFEVTSSANVASTSLPATQIFGQPILKNTPTISEVTTTPSTAINFGAAVFPSITPTFSTSTSASTTSVFSGFANASTGASSLAAPVSSTVSPFQNSLSKPFGQLATTSSMPATSFSISPSNTSASTISFGLTAMTTTTTTTTTTTAASSTTASITPAFGKSPVASPTSNAQFPGVQTISSTANVFEKPIISPASTPFGNSSSSVFSNVPAASSSASSIFGGTGSSNTNSIFGSTPLSSASGNIFGGNATVGSVTGFGMASSRSLFGDTSAQKSGGIMFGETTNTASTSPFGSTSNNTTAGSSVSGASVFGSPATNTSPIQQPMLGNQPAFGQAPAFGASPVFGSAPIFGGSKSFGSGFGSPPTFESPGIGFGSQPVMQGSMMENMPKVFGEVAGNSTFESLANQSGGLSFGSLAQKSPESEKPTFTTGSSFSSWR